MKGLVRFLTEASLSHVRDGMQCQIYVRDAASLLRLLYQVTIGDVRSRLWRAEVLIKRSAGLVPLMGSEEGRSMPVS